MGDKIHELRLERRLGFCPLSPLLPKMGVCVNVKVEKHRAARNHITWYVQKIVNICVAESGT